MGRIITYQSLARGLDAVNGGIPSWAADEILNTAVEADQAQSLGAGYLRFPSGAHGEVGSNTWVFRRLAKAVIALIAGHDRSHRHEEVSCILQRYFFD
jgi:hypothetical protein